jgi:hypothetical protein
LASADLIGVTPRDGAPSAPIARHVPHELSLADLEWAEQRLEPVYAPVAPARSGVS